MTKLSRKKIKDLAIHFCELHNKAVQDGFDGYAMYSDEASRYIDAKEQDVIDAADEVCEAIVKRETCSCEFQLDSDNVGCFMSA